MPWVRIPNPDYPKSGGLYIWDYQPTAEELRPGYGELYKLAGGELTVNLVDYQEWVRLIDTGEYRTLPPDVVEAHVRAYGMQMSIPWHWAMDANSIPSGLEGKPLPAWAAARSGGVVSHFHVDQMRLVQVRALTLRGSGPLDIPITDDEGNSLLGTEFPPKVVVRKESSSELTGDDFVTDPKTAPVTWDDIRMSQPLVLDTFTRAMYSWQLRLERTPRPHWVISVFADWHTTNTDPHAFGWMIHLLGNGSLTADHDPFVYEEGSDWAHGHVRKILSWQAVSDVDSGETFTTSDIVTRRAHLVIHADIADLATVGTIYLATPNGGSADTPVFEGGTDDCPMVRVYASRTPTQTQSTTQTTWGTSTFGLGGDIVIPKPPMHTINGDWYSYWSNLDWDPTAAGGSGNWRVRIENDHVRAPTGTSRTFYTYAIGRRDGY
jgi:hypothetical protein